MKGDKVRIRAGERAGARGVVERVDGDRVLVRLDPHRKPVRVLLTDITNLSLAARKAWTTMPNRRVGRPRTGPSRDRVSVTLRIDRDVWTRFRAKEHDGTIEDRTAIVNLWLRQALDRLEVRRG